MNPYTQDLYVLAFNSSNPYSTRALYAINPDTWAITRVSNGNFPYATQLAFSCSIRDVIFVQSHQLVWTVDLNTGVVTNAVQISFYQTCNSDDSYDDFALCYDPSSKFLRSLDVTCSGSYSYQYFDITSSNLFSGWSTSASSSTGSIGWSSCFYSDKKNSLLVKNGRYLSYPSETSTSNTVVDIGSAEWTSVVAPTGSCDSSTVSNSESSSKLGVIVGASVGGGCAILIAIKIILLVLFCKRRSRNQANGQAGVPYKEQNNSKSLQDSESLASLESFKSGASGDSFYRVAEKGLSARSLVPTFAGVAPIASASEGSLTSSDGSFTQVAERGLSTRADPINNNYPNINTITSGTTVESLVSSDGSFTQVAERGLSTRTAPMGSYAIASPRSGRSSAVQSPESQRSFSSDRGLLSETSESDLSSCMSPASARSTDPWIVPYYELFFGEIISQGAYGTVYKGRWKSNHVAIRQMKTEGMSESLRRAFIRDIKVMVDLPAHPNVVKLLGVCREPMSMVTEYLENGNLHDYLQSRGDLPDVVMYNIALGIAKGMLHLHNQGIFHRNLNHKNVLLSAFLQPKLSDFGLSTTEVSSIIATTVETARWVAPEVLANQEFTQASDVYSYAILICYVYSRRTPYHQVSNDASISAMISSGELQCEVPTNAPLFMRDLLKSCLQHSPSQRPDFYKICSVIEKSKL